MSVQSEITRLNAAKENIIAAIAAKGVVVVEGEKLDALAGKITEISMAEDLAAVLDEQEAKLEELLLTLDLKSAGEGATIETWELTLTDGTVIEKRVVVA